MKKRQIMAALLLSTIAFCGFTQAQFSFLRFASEPGPNPHFSRYSWKSFISQDDFLSPGGTLVTDSFDRARFDSFEEFLDDVIGVWTVTNSAGQKGTFEILVLQESDFEPLELISPVSGMTLYSGQDFDIIVSPDDPNENGISFFSPDADVECQCVGDSGRIVLPFGLAASTGRFSSFDTEERDDLVTSAQGAIIISSVTLVSLTERAELDVVAVVLGDTNLDGVVGLLDVAPLIDLLNTGGYMPQADVNQDGVVDLVDIGPFIDLLTGG